MIAHVSGLLISQTNDTQKLYFRYDANGTPRAVKYNGTDYYYLYNLQGDVITIYDAGGNPVVNYKYDSWGKITATTGSMASTLGVYNPFRYRGYVYDTETGFYYLNSRYYDPETGRFINADGIIGANDGALSFNLFAYCDCNPINYSDPTGHEAVSATFQIFYKMVSVVSSILEFAKKGIPSSSNEIIGQTIDLGNGWRARIDIVRNNNVPGHDRHIHVDGNGKHYSQNDNGEPHDKKTNSKGSPPEWVKEKLKNKMGWDWDAKEKEYYKSTLSSPIPIPANNYGLEGIALLVYGVFELINYFVESVPFLIPA